MVSLGNCLCRIDRSTAATALLAVGQLVVIGAFSGPAEGQTNVTAARRGWAAEVLPGASRVERESDLEQGEAWSTRGQSNRKSTANTQPSAPRKTGKKDSNADLFRPGPQYDKNYDAQGNVDIYGAKVAVEPPRPPVELGRQQYTSGLYDESNTLLGQLNPLLPGLAIYGDWRTAVAYNSNNGKDIAQVATRLNLDVDLKLTGTERIHAFFAPLQNNNKFTRFEFGGGDGNKKFTDEYDFNPQTLFFEGDIGSLYSGFSGQPAKFDVPFVAGLFPLFLQNGIWANDAILGGAVSLTARNSRKLGLPNYDITFFAAADNVDNKGIIGGNKDDNNKANLFGVTAFVDAFSGYIEGGYGLVQGREDREGLQVHFLTAAYTRRYYNTVSNSTRVFANFGEDPKKGNPNGFAIISENSLITSLPSTLIPYANFFIGFDNPQPLVDGNGAGILKNVGINFETDALTGYPKLNDTGSNAFGGAIGLQYLFNLNQQLVFEVASVQPFGTPIAGIGAVRAQYGFGVRYQIPIDRAWLFRADATYQIIEGADQDNFGMRAEIRRKF